MVDRVESENRKINFQLSQIKNASLLSTDEFSDIIRSSNNEAAKRVIYIESIQPAIDLYMDDPNSNRNDIIKWLDCVYEGVVAGEEIQFMELNNTGYMYLNLLEKTKAQKCLERAYNELRHRNINDPDLDDSTAALIVYNYAVVTALLEDKDTAIDMFNEAIRISEMVSDWSPFALNFLKLSDDEKIDINETREKNIDLVELAQLNLDLLKEG